MLWGLLILLAAGVIGAIAIGDAGTLGGFDGATIASLVASIVLLIYIGLPYLTGSQGPVSKRLQEVLVWVGLMLALVLAYSFRDDAKHLYERVAGELAPPGHSLSVTNDRDAGRLAVRIRRQPGGHFSVRASVNGETMTMLVDTGASTIVLTQSDARDAGININELRYTIPVRTANGMAFAAAANINSIAIGEITMRNLDVMVAKPGALNGSLLGMNFLTRLRSYEFSGEFLTLRG